MTCCGFVRRVWRWLRPGQVPEKEDTTALGVSQAAVSDSNQNSSPSPPTERSSDPTRSSQTSLCNICAHGLRLDDRRAGGALAEPSNDDAAGLSFPSLKPEEKQNYLCDFGEYFMWKGGAQYEQRDITPPHLSELSDECKFCHTVKSVLLNQLGQHEWWQTTTTKLRFQVQYEWVGWTKKGVPNFKLFSLKVEPKHPELEDDYSIRFPIAAPLGSCEEWLHITARPLDAESSFSERNVNLIRSWLDQCNTDRNCCLSVKHEEFLPTRLLDLGAQGSNNPSITLVETQSMAQLKHAARPLKYICLSYCWGAAQPPLKTTTSTIEDYRAGISMESMPRVFRDAVVVARTLGIRYLWIDALCIIQDCPKDWEKEAAAMANIFSYSWMTVGAVTTSSCHETLFHPRQNLSIDVEFQSSIKQNITGTISILQLSEYIDYPLNATLENSTWNTRGWVWQEQRLSQRLLMFGEKMLHLRCHQRMFHEYGTHYRWPLLEARFISSLDGPENWTKVMRLYSHRELSKRSDRLAAISGFVKAVAQKLEDIGKPETYIAGIWLTENASVRSQLSWLLENPTISLGQLLRYHSDQQQYVAPSWSWISFNQPVYVRTYTTRPEFQVVSHNILPARTDSTIAIAPGSSITLLGKLRNIPGRPSMGTKSSAPRTIEWYPWASAPCWEAPYSGDDKAWRLTPGWEEDINRRIRYFLDWDPSAQDCSDDDLEAHLKLFLLTGTTGGRAKGLVLFPVSIDPRLFLRVGYFEAGIVWEESPEWEETEVVII